MEEQQDTGLLGFTDAAADFGVPQALEQPGAAEYAPPMDPMTFTADPMGLVAGGAEMPATAPATAYVDPFQGAPAAAHVDPFQGAPAAAYVDPFQGVPVKDNSGLGGGKTIPEMSALREWEDKHERELEESARQEENEKKERRKAAAEELAKWYEERSSSVTKRRSSNRAEEEGVEASRSEASKPVANPWEHVVDLIDTSARTADESRDTSRMRALLIQLKSSPVVRAA